MLNAEGHHRTKVVLTHTNDRHKARGKRGATKGTKITTGQRRVGVLGDEARSVVFVW